MCQNSDSYNLLNEIRYKILCRLYARYRSAMKIAVERASDHPIANAKINEIDAILLQIEKYPIAWSYYNKQDNKFSSEFENLIIFRDDQISK